MSRSLGSLRIDLVALTGKFESSFKTAQGVIDKFGLAARRVGTIATGSFSRMSASFQFLRNTVLSLHGVFLSLAAVVGGAKLAGSFHAASEAVDDLGKKSKVLGLSIEELSVLRFSAGESGVEFDTLAKMVGKASKNIGTFARTGAGPAAEAIRSLGIQVRDSNGGLRGMTELLPEIATAFEGMTDEGERLSLSEAIFGREGGNQFVQWLEDSGGFMEDLARQTERATNLGVVFSERQFDRLKAYNDAIGRIGESWLGLRARIMVELAPALEDLANRLALSLARVGEFGANLASVIVAGFEERDIFQSRNEPDLNVAFAAVKRLLSTFFNALWAEVSTRIALFATQLWDFLKTVLIDVLGKLGEAIIKSAQKLGSLLGELLSFLGSLLLQLVDILKEVGVYLGKTWEDTGKKLEGYATELEETRAIHWAFFNGAIATIDELGEKYRDAREEAEGYGDSVKKVGASASAIATTWSEFFAGMKQEWRSLRDEANDFATLGRNVFGSMARGISEGLASAIAKGEASFKNFGKVALGVLTDVATSIAQMVLQFLFMRAIVQSFGGYFGSPVASTGSGGTGTQIPDFAGPATPTFAAKGGVFGFAAGGVASGVLDGPMAFPFSKKVGVAGEAGPEVGFAPLRKIGGELGVKAVGGETVVQIIDQRKTGERPEVSESTGGDGKKFLRVVIRDEVRRGIGEGEYDRAFSGSFGLTRKGTAR